jgi:hypothetical protein
MSAPKFAPTPVLDEVRTYASPEVAPAAWVNDRPTDIERFQPVGERLGFQGPDQGYGLMLANRFRDRLNLIGGPSADDAIRGCLNIALRRASLYGRAPVIHDLTIAFTMWGFLDANPPHELVQRRAELFEGVGNVHHYKEGRAIADLVPEATLRMTPAAVSAASPVAWRTLTGA